MNNNAPNINNNSQNENYNPYREFLPENRIKKEEGVILPKFSKFGIYPFYILIVFLVISGVLFLRGKNIFKPKPRIYNMNLNESINLDTIYMASGVEWVSNSDSVVITNNVVTANASGEVYLYAKKDNKIVSDATINVLTGDEALSIDNHAVSATVGSKSKIVVNRNDSSSIDSNIKESSKKDGFFTKIFNFFKGIFNKGNSKDNTDKLTSADKTSNVEKKSSVENNNKKSSSSDSGSDNANYDYVETGFDNNFDNEDYNFNVNYDYGDANFEEDNYYDDFGDEEDNYSNLTFESSDESIAIVDSEGNIEAISPGTVEIIVTDENGNQDHTVITVTSDELNLHNEEYTIVKGNSVSVGYVLVSNTYKEKDIKWSSDNSSVATVNSEGVITGVEVGNANIYVSVGEIKKTIKVSVKSNVVLPTDLKLSADSVGLVAGDNKKITAEVFPNNASNKTVKWSSDNAKIASVDKDGLISGKIEGTTKIIATTINGIKKEVVVTVSKKVIPVDKITITPASLNLVVGKSSTLTTKIEPANASNRSYTLTSSNTNIVTIDKSGNVKAVGAGTATITAKSADGKVASTIVTVKKPATPIVQVTGIKLNKTKDLIYLNSKNKTVSLVATISPANATNKTISWTSSNTNVATVDNNGKVKIKDSGIAVITAKSSNGTSASYTVTVKEKVIIVVTASFGIRITERFGKTSDQDRALFVSKNGNQFVGCKTVKSGSYQVQKANSKCSLRVIYYPGSGFDFQYGDVYKNADSGKVKAKKFINYFADKKDYTEFYVFFTFPSNSTHKYGCDGITDTEYRSHASGYKKAVSYLRSGGYNVTAYLGSHSPVEPSNPDKYKNIVYSTDANSCKANYRSNKKLYLSNRKIEGILSSSNYDIKYLEIFNNFLQVKGSGQKQSFTWKKFSWYDYESNSNYSVSQFYTIDGLHFSNFNNTDRRVVDAYMHSMFDKVSDI